MKIDIEDILKVQKAIKEHDGEFTKEELYRLINEKKMDDLSKKELICTECGFVTHSYKDMVLHLAQEQAFEAENCDEQRIEFAEDLKDEL